MGMGNALVNYLLADETVSGLVDDRIYLGFAKQRQTTPYIVVTEISNVGEHTQDGRVGIGNPHYSVECWASQYDQSHDAGDAVRDAIDGYKGSMGDPAVTVQSIFFDDERDEIDTEQTPKLFGVIQDYYVSYEDV